MILKRITVAWICLLFANLFWAGNAVMARFIFEDIPPFFLAFWRWFLAFLLLLPFAWPYLRGQREEIQRRWPVIFVLGILGISIYNTILYLSAHLTTAVNITLVGSSLPLIVLLFSWQWLQKYPNRWQLLGIAASLIGVTIIISKGQVSNLLNLYFNLGDLMVFGITCCWAIYSVVLRKYPIRLHPIATLTVVIAAGLPLLLLLSTIEQHYVRTFNFNWQTLLVILYAAIFPSILSYLFWDIGVKELGPNIASMSVYLMPLMTAIVAVPLLSERLWWHHYLGGLLILVGLYFGVLFKDTKRANPDI
jgi:drug/metabolite transporter (DMT)-like permease